MCVAVCDSQALRMCCEYELASAEQLIEFERATSISRHFDSDSVRFEYTQHHIECDEQLCYIDDHKW